MTGPPQGIPPGSAVRRTRHYLGSAFVVEHAPATAEDEALDTGILLLPPLGYEDTCAYRPLRVLADALAQRGHVVLRLDWPALGDSAFDAGEVDLVAQGAELVAAAAQELRSRGLARVVGIAVRAGGLIALAAEGLDDLALWGVPLSGKAYLREERAFHQMAARAYGDIPADAPPLPEGGQEAGGFLYGPRTVAALQGLSAERLAAGRAYGRVLLLGRDGLAVPDSLQAAFRHAGAEVSAASPRGLGDLLENAYKSVLRPEITKAVLDWLEPFRARTALRPAAREMRLELPDGVSEHPLLLPGGAGELSGIVCVPAGGAAPGAAWTLFLNAGGIRRSGPNRLWTRAARALARQGRPSVRFDVRDVGDSDGVSVPHADLEEMYSESAIEDAVQVHDWLRAGGAGAVEVVGLCSGSYLGIQTAARRPVARALLFNCLAFVWNDDARVNGVTSHIGASLFDGRRWRRLLTGRIDAGSVARALAAKAWLTATRLFRRPAAGAPDEVEALLSAVAAQGTDIHLVSSEGDPSLPYLARHVPPERRPRVTLLPGVDHTVRPLWAHERVVRMILDRS